MSWPIHLSYQAASIQKLSIGSFWSFTIAICAMWPTVLNTALGVRSIPQDYLNVAKVLQLSPAKTFFKVLLPAALPYMFTGFRLSLGIAWLVIVAVEMLTGTPGIGGFLWQEYNSLIYEHIILCILTIGIVGFILDRLMSAVERRLQAMQNPGKLGSGATHAVAILRGVAGGALRRDLTQHPPRQAAHRLDCSLTAAYQPRRVSVACRQLAVLTAARASSDICARSCGSALSRSTARLSAPGTAGS